MGRSNQRVSIKRAVLLNASAKYTTVILQLIYTAILSRILTPEDYGTIAVINVFIVFFQLLTDMGFGTGIIQDKSLSEADIRNIYSVSVYLGCILQVLFIGVSFPISLFYDDSIYFSLGCILSFALVFNAFNTIPNALLLKEKRFRSIAVRTVTVALISFMVTILFALKGAGVYAFTIQAVLNAAGLYIWNASTIKIKFVFRPSLKPIMKIWSYSAYQFGAQALNYFNRNLDNLLIGKFFSKEELGFYNKAYTLMQYPINYLPGVITPVLHPLLSDHQDDRKYIYQKYIQLLRVLSILGCFGSAFCFFAGEEIILIVFGSQWEAAILPFKILSLSLWAQILTNTMAPIYQSAGNTKLMFKSLMVSTAIIVTMIISGILTHSIIYVAFFVAIAYVLNFFVTFFILNKYGFGESFLHFMLGFKYEGVMLMTMLISTLFYPELEINLVLTGFVKFGYLLCIYLIALFVTQQFKVLLSAFKG